MGKEAVMWDWLRAGVLSTLPHFALLERVENGVLDGMADINFLIRGQEGWLELKAVELPVRPSTPVLGKKEGLNVDQINWHIRRNILCGLTWVMIRAKPHIWLISGVFAKDMNTYTVEELTNKARFHHEGSWNVSTWQRFITALAGSSRTFDKLKEGK